MLEDTYVPKSVQDQARARFRGSLSNDSLTKSFWRFLNQLFTKGLQNGALKQ